MNKQSGHLQKNASGRVNFNTADQMKSLRFPACVRRSVKEPLRCVACALAFAFFVVVVSLLKPVSMAAQQKAAIDYYEDALSLVQSYEYLAAIDAYRMALEKNPDYLEASLGLGEALNMTGAAREALEIFDDIYARYPSEVRAILGRAKAHYLLGNLQQALGDYELAEKTEANMAEARYGMALVYEAMGKDEWAQRSVKSLLKSDPYHYETLLLSARLLAKRKRLDEAEQVLRKAINSEQERAEGYLEYGKIFYQRYLQNGDQFHISDAREQLDRAILIQPSLYEAYVVAAGFDLLQSDYYAAGEKLMQARSYAPSNVSVAYNLALVSEKTGNLAQAEALYSAALSFFPDMPLLIARYENHLVDNEYRFGSPARKKYSDYHYDLYRKNSQESLPDYALMHLRLTLLMDPLAIEARRELANYYKVLGYGSFYISQLKNIERMEPSQLNREALNRAVIERREKLYSREGFALGDPPRDVVRVAVLPFDSVPDPFSYFDAGDLVAKNLVFSLEQYGKHEAFYSDHRPRADEAAVDFVLSGVMEYNPSHIEIRYTLRDMKGSQLASFSLYESGKDYLNRINYRAASRIYNILPLRGKILKETFGAGIVNVGSFDGVKEGDLLYTYDYAPDRRRRKILLDVTEVDTMLAAAKVQNPRFAGRISQGSVVFGLERHAAEKIR